MKHYSSLLATIALVLSIGQCGNAHEEASSSLRQPEAVEEFVNLVHPSNEQEKTLMEAYLQKASDDYALRTVDVNVTMESLKTSDKNHDHGPGWPAGDPDSREKTMDLMESADDASARKDSFPTIVQPVSFVNLMMKDGTGQVSYASMQAQIDQLNRAYSGSEAKAGGFGSPRDAKIRFKLAGVRYVVNNDYFNYCSLPSTIAQMRPKYMMDGSRHLNVYICWCQANLGLAWLPYDSWFRQNTGEDHYALGPTLHWELLPGNKFRGGLWNKGNILTHEIGHSYGLRHPYEGDCDGDESDSDQIADTPRQSGNPLATCKAVAGRDSCKNNPGKDDMQNYMVATADSCRDHFTPGQVNYMQNVIRKYKPTLMKQLAPSCVAAVDSSDNSPDLQPCVDGTVKTAANGKKWCKTDPEDGNVWAWACCPDSMYFDQDACRQGTPNFGTPRSSPRMPSLRG